MNALRQRHRLQQSRVSGLRQRLFLHQNDVFSLVDAESHLVVIYSDGGYAMKTNLVWLLGFSLTGTGAHSSPPNRGYLVPTLEQIEQEKLNLSNYCKKWDTNAPRGRQKALIANQVYWSSTIFVGYMMQRRASDFTWPTSIGQCVIQTAGYLSSLSDKEEKEYHLTLGEVMGLKP